MEHIVVAVLLVIFGAICIYGGFVTLRYRCQAHCPTVLSVSGIAAGILMFMEAVAIIGIYWYLEVRGAVG